MESVNSTTDTVVTNNQVVDIHRELMQLGLNDKQAELYLLLVKHKELRIQEIVNLSQLPRSSVYEHLNKLYKFGIAEEIVENNYKKIRAYPISSIGHNLNEEIQKLKRMSDNLGALEKTINLNISKHNDDLASVRYYRDRAGARQIYWNSLKAKNTVYVYSEWGRSKYVGKKFYEDFVSQSHVRNINEKVIINLRPKTLESIRNNNISLTSTARTKIENIRVADKKIIIKGDTLIYNNIYAQAYIKNTEIHGFEVEDSNFVNTQRSIFESIWDISLPVSNFI